MGEFSDDQFTIIPGLEARNFGTNFKELFRSKNLEKTINIFE